MPTIANELQKKLADLEEQIKQHDDEAVAINRSITSLLSQVFETDQQQQAIEIALLELLTTLPYGILTDRSQMNAGQIAFYDIALGEFNHLTTKLQQNSDALSTLRGQAAENTHTRKILLQSRLTMQDTLNKHLQSTIDQLQTKLNATKVQLNAPQAQDQRNQDPLVHDKPALLVRHKKISQREISNLALPPQWYPADNKRVSRPGF